ncbi:MAG: DUF2939 domain-containing protein [Flavobacteriaceae bacterium]|jgi:hypothetical protein|nr:DUF2939 domain-containing protein [Flavobacteriaceae bacterium]
MSSKKIKLILIITPLIVLFSYFFTALYSFHQFHKGIYYNDKKLIKDYVEWDELRENFKNYINIQLLKETKKDDDLKELGDLGLLFTGLAGKLVESLVDTYLNPEGLSMLIEKSEKKDEIPKPTIITLLGGFTIMDFNGHSSFYITYENEGEEFPIFFNRKGLTWKITQIEFPEDLLSSLK